MKLLLQAQISVCRDNSGIVAGSINDTPAGGKGEEAEVEGGWAGTWEFPHPPIRKPRTLLALTFPSGILIFQNTAVLMYFTGFSSSPPSLQKSFSTKSMEDSAALQGSLAAIFLCLDQLCSQHSIWRPNHLTHSRVVLLLYFLLPYST